VSDEDSGSWDEETGCGQQEEVFSGEEEEYHGDEDYDEEEDSSLKAASISKCDLASADVEEVKPKKP